METVATTTELTTVVKESGIEKSKGEIISKTLGNFFEKANEWNQTIEALQINDVSEVGKMKMAREGRLTLKNQRIACKKIVDEKRQEVKVKMAELKRISAMGKLNEVKEFIREVTESGEKLIVFCVLHSIVDELLREFPNAVTVTGRDNTTKKQQAIDSFQNDESTNLIICNIKAAGVGITLTASSRVAFVEYPWTYADCVQCEDRAHRIGQKNNVMCTYFLGKDTVDEDLYRMIQEKRHVANTITGATDTMEMSFVDSMMGLFNIKD